MLSVAVTVPPVMFIPVKTLPITAEFVSVIVAAPAPEPVASPINDVM
jgi:hypothetical protein